MWAHNRADFWDGKSLETFYTVWIMTGRKYMSMSTYFTLDQGCACIVMQAAENNEAGKRNRFSLRESGMGYLGVLEERKFHFK